MAFEPDYTHMLAVMRNERPARGYALGSGNSIPEYVPVEGYLAMLRGAQAIRQLEGEPA